MRGGRLRLLVVLLAVLGLVATDGTPAAASANANAGGYTTPSGGGVAVEVSSGTGSAGGSSAGAEPVDVVLECEWRVIDVSPGEPVYDLDGAEIGRGDGRTEWFQEVCFLTAGGTPVFGPIVPRQPIDPRTLALRALAEADVRQPAVRTNPEADRDQLVRVPVWLWVGEWSAVTEVAPAPGLSATVIVSPQSIRWDMGDGAVVTCAGPGTPYDQTREESSQSTDCSHTYTRTSAAQPGERYRARATITWTVSWSATDGSGGSLPTVTSATDFSLRVAEAQALSR